MSTGFPSIGLNAGGAFKRAWDEYGRLIQGQGVGLGQLAGAEASDPLARQAQADFGDLGGQYSGGAGVAGATGLFGALPTYAGQGTITQRATTDQARNLGSSGQLNVDESAANAFASQAQANLALEQAQNQQAGQTLSLFSGLTDLLTNPKGLGANIMGSFGGTPGQSPLGSIFGKLGSLFGSGGGSSIGGGADLIGSLLGGGGGGISDLTAALGSAGGAGGVADVGATAAEGGAAAGSGIFDWLTSLFAAAPALAA